MSVCLYVCTHGDRFRPNINHGLKISEMVAMVTRNSQIWYLARKILGATDLKLGMPIQLHSVRTWAGSHLATLLSFPV